MAKKITVGSQIAIPAGTRVTRLGVTSKRAVDTTVTVREVAVTRTGKTRVFWKSHGYLASAVIA